MDITYFTLSYNSKARWLSYWYQISEVVTMNPQHLLVIGKGSGIVENTIKIIAPQIKITSVDLNPKLLPDVIADMRHMPFESSSFDCILCCQVLEHIPFDDVRKALSEFHRVVRYAVVISVPQARKFIKIEFAASKMGTKRFIFKYPLRKKSIRSKQHFWEINNVVSYKEFQQLLESYFVIEKSFLNEINCYHRFFILRK
jgi:ubiquinone/menaquinone biosynthesis C-methylase UbiE